MIRALPKHSPTKLGARPLGGPRLHGPIDTHHRPPRAPPPSARCSVTHESQRLQRRAGVSDELLEAASPVSPPGRVVLTHPLPLWPTPGQSCRVDLGFREWEIGSEFTRACETEPWQFSLRAQLRRLSLRRLLVDDGAFRASEATSRPNQPVTVITTITRARLLTFSSRGCSGRLAL